MNTKLVIDDLFLDKSHKKYFRFYENLYGVKITRPLSFSAFTLAVEKFTRKKISETHIFYLEDRPSLFLTETIVKYAAPLLEENGFIDREIEIPVRVKNDIVNLLKYCGVTVSEILSESREAVFHSCEWLAVEAAKFTAGCESAVVFANDRIYTKATKCPDLIFIHPSDDPTMPDDVPYTVDYLILSSVYGVDP